MAWQAVAVAVGWCIGAGVWVNAQGPPAKNPFEGDAAAIKSGMGLFRARCADCHGMDARGVRAPDITQVWASGRTDEGLYGTIKNGIAGTEMPPQPRLFDHETWYILAYLRTLVPSAPADPPRGDAANGEKIYRANCASCHRVNGAGGRIGPDLSRIGASRSREVLERRIRGAIEGFLPGYEPLTLTPQSGETVVGVKKNEDLFSVQIMDTGERIQGYDKASLKEIQRPPRSAMPAFGSNRLSDSDLADLVRYLQTLRGFDPSVPQ
jgi:putative heme-binding domain-containing protein